MSALESRTPGLVHRTGDTGSARPLLAWLAVVAGTALGIAAIVHDDATRRLPAGAVAVVGEHAIAREQWQRAIAAVEADRALRLDGPGRRAVLQRLIDEELLFQHAIDGGLARNDPGLRKTLVAGLIDATTAGGVVDEAAARTLFESDPLYFAAQPRLRVAIVAADVSDGADPEPGQLYAALHTGARVDGLRPLHSPDVALAPAPIAQRWGGSIAEALRTAETQQVLGPFDSGSQRLYAMLHERIADRPRYEDVADAVRSELARREAEAALARLLQTLRHTTQVRIADGG